MKRVTKIAVHGDPYLRKFTKVKTGFTKLCSLFGYKCYTVYISFFLWNCLNLQYKNKL